MRQVPPRAPAVLPPDVVDPGESAGPTIRDDPQRRNPLPARPKAAARAGDAIRTAADFARWKAEKRKISMVTAYDAWSARLVAGSMVDAILVGDSAAMVMHGYRATVHATLPMMRAHTQAVARAATESFIVSDLPFLTFREDVATAVRAVRVLVSSGAHAVKLEGVDGHDHVVRHIVESGIPVMGHVGLTPQSVHRLGGYRPRGKEAREAETLFRQAHALEQAGCFAIVLECVPASLAARITADLTIPTIGIGAGDATDGQILVLHDLWGIATTPVRPRFVRHYCDGDSLLRAALDSFDADVKAGRFPTAEESYS
jgi:3-methyl-2-oxobutanoate hydroxymethyltransferase